MSLNNLPRIPLRKGTTNDSVTDYRQDTSVPSGTVKGDYRAPVGRVLGNTVFRRDINGSLDLDYAMHVVLDCLHKQKNDASQLTDLERLILSMFFPNIFTYVDPVIAAKMKVLQFHLNDFEIMAVSARVAAHLMYEQTYAVSPKD